MSTGSSTSNVVIVDISKTMFKSLCIGEVITIPINCSDISEVVDYSVASNIYSVYAISTPVGVSNEGQQLTGSKLMVCGNICVNVNMVSVMPEEPVHSLNNKIPFSTFIVIPTTPPINYQISDVHDTLEDVVVEKVNERQFRVCANLLIDI
jgi:hypothetical protein